MIPKVLPLVALAALAIGAFFLHSRPAETVAAGPGCAIQKLTGLHCPGCGATRAAAHLTQGRLVAALGSNALVIVIVPLMIYHLIASAAGHWTRWQIPQLGLRRSLWVGAILVVVAFTVLRNLLPFNFLAP